MMTISCSRTVHSTQIKDQSISIFYLYFLLINIIHIEALLFLVLMISSWLLTVTRLPTTDFFTSLSSWPTTLSLVSRWRTENGDYVIDKFPDLTLTLVTTKHRNLVQPNTVKIWKFRYLYAVGAIWWYLDLYNSDFQNIWYFLICW